MRLATGIEGLDEVLAGGLIGGRSYLVRGGPGTGKTILGLHFLAAGETGLLVTLGEAEGSLRQNAATLGFDLEGVEVLDLSPHSEYFSESRGYDIFAASEVEREATLRRIHETVERVRPSRIFLDGMTQLRYLAPDAYQFRRQAMGFLRFAAERGATVLFSSESLEAPDEDLQFLADGILEMSSLPQGRGITVTKYRGSDFRAGRHSMQITARGILVYPRLVPQEHHRPFSGETISSGVVELDAMLEGGLERGTITLITGPSGVGKTTVGLQFMKEAASRGERSVVYVFEEARETLLRRSESLGIPARGMLARGTLDIVQVEPLLLSADQFAGMVRREVEGGGARILMIDSIAGYRLALRGEDLVSHLHGLAKYLQNMGVAVLLVNETEAITGDFRITEIGVSYLADNVLFLRYLEMGGEMHKALGVLKKRLSDFEKAVRELRITPGGIVLGTRLANLRGILNGVPEHAAAGGSR